MNNGEKEIMIKKEFEKQYIKLNYIRGRIKKTKNKGDK